MSRDRDKRLIIGALFAIAVVVYAIGIAWRINAGDEQPKVPTVALMPTFPPDATAIPTETLPAPTTAAAPSTDVPTDVPTEVPTNAPTNAPTIPPTNEPTLEPMLPTDTPPPTPDSVLPTDSAASLIPTPIQPTPGSVIGPTETTETPTVALPTPLPTDTPGGPTRMPNQPAVPVSQLEAVVTASAGLMLRAGPGTTYPVQAVLLQGARVTVFARTADSAWAKVRQPQTEGWVSAQYLQISGDLNAVPVEGAEAIAALPTTLPCVSVVGDSIAYGEVIFEIPGTGFMKVKFAPFAQYIQQQLDARGAAEKNVTDRSYPGIGITSPRHKPYYDIPQYPQLIKDRCRFTVVLPWVNDLSSGIDPIISAPQHAANLAQFARRLIENNPQGRVLLVNYYLGNPAPFSIGMANGFTPAAIQMFNEEMAKSCKEGELSKMPQVTCIDSASAFVNVGAAYVVGPMTRREIEAIQLAPLTPEEQKMLDYYTSLNPNGQLIGDGIHMSSLGKTVLAAYIVDVMLKLPTLPPPG